MPERGAWDNKVKKFEKLALHNSLNPLSFAMGISLQPSVQL